MAMSPMLWPTGTTGWPAALTASAAVSAFITASLASTI
jgi:hypothetical protein